MRHACAPSSDGLLLDASNGQHLTRERQFARHGQVGAHGLPAREGEERGRDGHARGRAVLWRGAFRDVHVDFMSIQRSLLLASQLRQARPDVGHGYARRLLHDAAELAGDGELGRRSSFRRRVLLLLLLLLLRVFLRVVHDGVVVVREVGGLDEQSRATHGSPRQTHDHAARHVARVEPVAGELGLAHELHEARGGHDDVALRRGRVGPAADDLQGELARDLLHQFLQRPHAGLARVAADQLRQRVVVDRRLVRLQAGLLDGDGHEVILRDLHFLRQVVARQADHLHPVQQRRRDGVLDVGGADEEASAEVDGDVQVVVHKVSILRRVQELQQRRRGVAAVARPPDLVHLVDEDERVTRFCDLETLDRLTRHGPDVRAPVTLDLGHVRQAADAEAVVLAAQRVCDGHADGSLADAGRPDEAENLAPHFTHQIPNRH
mmetsp:Transcript_10725/g.35653  ORF Transcript_10725/g.35653 Transcript_10725/m.35653 type:complete len:436 (+) Transcript_10725:619-1926(+)